VVEESGELSNWLPATAVNEMLPHGKCLLIEPRGLASGPSVQFCERHGLRSIAGGHFLVRRVGDISRFVEPVHGKHLRKHLVDPVTATSRRADAMERLVSDLTPKLQAVAVAR
jgi:hypothetical protein